MFLNKLTVQLNVYRGNVETASVSDSTTSVCLSNVNILHTSTHIRLTHTHTPTRLDLSVAEQCMHVTTVLGKSTLLVNDMRLFGNDRLLLSYNCSC